VKTETYWLSVGEKLNTAFTELVKNSQPSESSKHASLLHCTADAVLMRCNSTFFVWNRLEICKLHALYM
jgi:hypothetical protein